jgi:hypothetical protein
MVRLTGDQAVGNGLIEVGKGYVFQVLECDTVKAQSSGNEGFGLKVEVVQSEIEGQVGKELSYQNFYGPRLFKLAAALILTNKATGQPFTPQAYEQLQADLKAKKDVGEFDFDPTEAVSRQFGAEVVLGKPKQSGNNVGKQYPEIGFDIHCVVDAGGGDAGAGGGGSALD